MSKDFRGASGQYRYSEFRCCTTIFLNLLP